MGGRLYLVNDKQKKAIKPLTDPQLIAQALNIAGMSAWSCDLATNELSWTDGVFEIFGVNKDSGLERTDIVSLYHGESKEIMEHQRTKAIETRSGFSMEAQIRQPDGDVRWIRLAGMTRCENNRAVQLYGIKQDITAERIRWDELRKMAENDPLTGLSNRTLFQNDFLNLAPGSDKLVQVGALAIFDLNTFKQINDQYGHSAGDACIAAFGRRLQSAFPHAVMISRIGGDEFVLLLPATLSPQGAERFVRSKLHSLVAEVTWQGHNIQIGVSVGMAFTCQDGKRTPEDVFLSADMAMYSAKQSGMTDLRIAA